MALVALSVIEQQYRAVVAVLDGASVTEVVDAAGHLVAWARMDGAPWIAPEVALGKAWTAAAYGAPSAAQGDKMKELYAFSASISAATHGRFTPQIVGLPITSGNDVIGAMGASGGTGQQDEEFVRAALG